MNKNTLSFLVDIESYIEGYEIVDITIAHNMNILILCINKIPERVNEMFVKSKTKESFDYKIIQVNKFDTNKITEINVKNQHFNYHYVNLLEKDTYLLVGARCTYYSNDVQDKNTKVIDVNGDTIREFVLGDGIQDVLVTADGDIWTSYFDEGVFGNNGWNNPIGSCGLIQWDKNGNQKYRYQGGEDHFICDCYALNIDQDGNIWFYYYDQFELVKIDKNFKISYFKPEIEGADGFLVCYNRILLKGNYENPDKYTLFENSHKDEFKCLNTFELIYDDKLAESNVFAIIGSCMVHLIENKIYEYNLEY